MTDLQRAQNISKACKEQAQTVLLLQEEAARILSIVRTLKTQVLQSRDWLEEESRKKITDPQLDWLLSDEEFHLYRQEMEKRMTDAKLPFEPGQCPALVAVRDRQLAEEALIQKALPFLKMTGQQAALLSLPEQRSLADCIIELCLVTPLAAGE